MPTKSSFIRLGNRLVSKTKSFNSHSLEPEENSSESNLFSINVIPADLEKLSLSKSTEKNDNYSDRLNPSNGLLFVEQTEKTVRPEVPARRNSNPLPRNAKEKNENVANNDRPQHRTPPPKLMGGRRKHSKPPQHFTFEKSEILNSYLTSRNWPEMVNRASSETITTFAAITRIPSPPRSRSKLKELDYGRVKNESIANNDAYTFTYHRDENQRFNNCTEDPLVDIPLA